ncbi:uncharacterized protein LOC110465172 [Mizuhopecten yessoensis]|uniref:Uncharacterized protein n=1 Tax=Mizuhopecten yessoensis TaxID=6573 RepID=A0A210PS94_MIZYE|nr:uncharacterized protein LOC110465172 [Mizuhopecten yessoensis]OWF39324.1 hypothetical protein KP79_PYT11783 [Mizuhopecten yessoensis]
MAIEGGTFRTSGRLRSGFYPVLIVVVLSLQLASQVDGTGCPQYVKTAASNCFGDYRTQLHSLQESDHALFSGVNVELLRSFCTTYNNALKCVQQLFDDCPPEADGQITESLKNQDAYGAHEELTQLCRNDNIYEVYARNQNCLQAVGSNSETCFENIMHTTVRLMQRIDSLPLQELCGDIKELIKCIKTGVRTKCSEEAAKIVEILVKPMVRRSTQCDYSIPSTTKKTIETHVTRAPTRDKTEQYVSGDNGAAGIQCHWLLLLVLALLAL